MLFRKSRLGGTWFALLPVAGMETAAVQLPYLAMRKNVLNRRKWLKMKRRYYRKTRNLFLGK